MLKELQFLEKAKEAVSDQAWLTAEAEIGFRLPDVFREFCKTYNGGIPTLQYELYPVPDLFLEFREEYGPNSKGIIAERLYGLRADRKSCDALSEFRSLRDNLEIALFPISEDIFGNQVVITPEDPDGIVYFRDHELWDKEGKPVLFPIAYSLEQFYNGLSENSEE